MDWNGKDVPSGLHDLPAGRYVVEAVNDADDAPLTEAQDRGVEHALEQYRQGQVVNPAQARQRLDALLKK